ncbi:hypothetical protein C8J57DRAFT_1733964 [Mycena rebaudengoi]|nr:hypothetical protein C8J57DRAFT_1733964 [Mycena rebaudengoi]
MAVDPSFIRQTWNLAVTFLCIGLFLDNLTHGINAVVWRDNADIKAHVYCDIGICLLLLFALLQPISEKNALFDGVMLHPGDTAPHVYTTRVQPPLMFPTTNFSKARSDFLASSIPVLNITLLYSFFPPCGSCHDYPMLRNYQATSVPKPPDAFPFILNAAAEFMTLLHIH